MNPVGAKKIIKRTSHIDGWLSVEAAMLISLVDEFQKQNGISGNIFEIGVHHGKSSILFSHLLSPSENLNICDLFGRDGNVSDSGAGDEEVFRRNLKDFGLRSATEIHKCFSNKLTPAKIGGNYRMFHIDGGHNPDEALGDLQLAREVIAKDGIIILDDPFRVEWPGVTEGLVKFLDANPDFEAIVVGFNKLLLSRAGIAKRYKDYISNEGNRIQYGLGFPWEYKILPFSNRTLHIFFVPYRYLGLKNFKVRVARFLREKPALRNLLTKIRN